MKGRREVCHHCWQWYIDLNETCRKGRGQMALLAFPVQNLEEMARAIV